jgi:hypothetical protein
VLPKAGALPIVIVRAGLESPEIAATVDDFLTAGADAGAALEVIEVPNGHHGFENLDPGEESRHAVLRAIRTVLGRLRD